MHVEPSGLRRMRRHAGVFILGCTPLCAIASVPKYTIEPLGSFGGRTQPWRVTENARVLGTSFRSDGSYHAFSWDDGEMTAIDPSLRTSVARGINAAEQIAGFYFDGEARAQAAVWQHGSRVELGTLGGRESWATGISTSGAAVGWSYVTMGSTLEHAFYWDGQTLTDLGTPWSIEDSVATDLNDAGLIVGYVGGTGRWRGVKWQGGLATTLPTLGGAQSNPFAVNEAGLIVGRSQRQGSQFRPALWDGNAAIDLGSLGGLYGAANDVNSHGQIVGVSQNSSLQDRAFLSTDGQMYDLNQQIINADGWVLRIGMAISDNGYIVGEGTLNGVERGFILTPVPEASTIALLTVAIAAVGRARRQSHPSS